MFDILCKKLLDETQKSRIKRLIVTRTAAKNRARNLIKMSEFSDRTPADIVASVGWCNVFMS